jgi:hypothetical protein
MDTYFASASLEHPHIAASCTNPGPGLGSMNGAEALLRTLVASRRKTQEQLESTNDKSTVAWNRWTSRVAPEVDRLYGAIMRAVTPCEPQASL